MMSLMTTTIVLDDRRRRELGAYLRSRRARLAPGDVGLAPGVRRRTPGLRREEVALLAGVGATWYTWLEQGRNVRPSAEVLNRLGDALRLDPVEKKHLFILANRPNPDPPSAMEERIDEPLRRVLVSLAMQPAYVTGRRWDVLAWNKAATAVFGDFAALEGDARNIMHLIFTDARHRKLLIEWESIARISLGLFRADSAKYVGDPDFERLIAALTRLSADFRRWWPQRDVGRPLVRGEAARSSARRRHGV
jgi:transcriptional regulator with XRE-family HTH domain